MFFLAQQRRIQTNMDAITLFLDRAILLLSMVAVRHRNRGLLKSHPKDPSFVLIILNTKQESKQYQFWYDPDMNDDPMIRGGRSTNSALMVYTARMKWEGAILNDTDAKTRVLDISVPLLQKMLLGYNSQCLKIFFCKYLFYCMYRSYSFETVMRKCPTE